MKRQCRTTLQPTHLEAVAQLGHRLFNVTVEAADGEVPVWDPAVRFFRLYRNGELKGYLYIDPFARPGGACLTITLSNAVHASI